MILNRLQLLNYKQYAQLDLEFREGLVGIIGKNGAGKSTIFEAILYCLFGKDENNKSLVRSVYASDAKSNVELELTFSIGEIQYIVKREYRGKALAVEAYLYKNDLLIAKGASAVDKELVRILHIERDAFKRSVFSGQKELSELSDTSGEARKRMIRKMLGLDTLDEVQTRINTDIRDKNIQIAGQRLNLLDDAALLLLKEEQSQLNSHIQLKTKGLKTETLAFKQTEQAFQEKKKLFDEESKRLNQYHLFERNHSQARERVKGLNEQGLILEQKLNQLGEQKSRMELDRPAFEAFENAKKQLKALELESTKQLNKKVHEQRIAETRQQIAEVQAKLESFEKQLLTKAGIDEQWNAKQAELSKLESDIEAKRAEFLELEKRIGGINNSIEERKEKLTALRALGKEGACPTCMQPLLEGYEKVLSELSAQIHALQTNEMALLEAEKQKIIQTGTNLKEQQSALISAVKSLGEVQSELLRLSRQKETEQAQMQKLQAAITRDQLIIEEIGAVQFNDREFEALKSRVGQDESRFLEFQKLESYLSRELPATQKSLLDNKEQLKEAQKQEETQLENLRQLAFDNAYYEAVRTEFASFDDVFTKQSAAIRALEKELLELENHKAKNREKLHLNDEIKSRIEAQLLEIETLRKLVEHLANFKTEILEKISPGISQEAGALFSRITRGKYEGIRVDENFDFAIADGGQYYPIDRFSGGEVDLANFCLRIAVTKAIMELSGAAHRLEFLAFDEIFGSQDEDRRLEMMLALNYLQEQFRQIYIVSHIESLRDYFPQLLEVQFGDQGSKVQWR
ncbi:MAG: SMC family ATPase [Saprospiraceae bacterium]|nr:SMC family ATPase [Saprospiraceae bacterium]